MTSLASAPESKSDKSFLEVWIITIGHSLTHWYPATFYILLPLIGVELGLNAAQIGMIVSAQYLAGAISNLPGGILVELGAPQGDPAGDVAVLDRRALFPDGLFEQLLRAVDVCRTDRCWQ